MRVICSERMDGGDREVLASPARYDRAAFVRACGSRHTGHKELLSKAVGSGVLAIRMASPVGGESGYLMHAKTGAAVGSASGPTMWVGSANDTWAGWSQNYEQVFSFHGPAFGDLTQQVFAEFSRLWTGQISGFDVIQVAEGEPDLSAQGRHRWAQQ